MATSGSDVCVYLPIFVLVLQTIYVPVSLGSTLVVIPAVADEPVDDVAHETDQLLGGSQTQLLYQQLMSVAGMIPASSVQQQSQRYQYQVVEEPTKSTNVDDNGTEDTERSGQVVMSARRSMDEGSRSDSVVVAWSGSTWWVDWHLPIFVILFAVIGVLAITFVVLLWLKNQMLSSSKQGPNVVPPSPEPVASPLQQQPQPPQQQQWIFHPVLQPPLDACSDSVQPPVSKPEPIRIRAKGLLERRGSSASLTIELHPSQENLTTVVTPTRECTTEEYLLSAGNVLSRGQLRQCLRDTRSLHREFWDLPSNHPEKAEVAGSGTKNRYRSILPNEHSRVRLPLPVDDPLASYINANYVRGYDGEEKAYIATQGPLPHTVSDFWLMVWSEHSNVIVMITKLWEKGRPKCEPYFPQDDEPVVYGEFEISVARLIQRDGYIIRELTVKNGDKTRNVLHFWYDTWPDHKTPASAQALVAMAKEVSDAARPEMGPVVVHCSAGIGRTGCFIAISVGMTQLLHEDNVDILGIVCQMRFDRGGMIQTAEQYEFVHRALCLFERSLPDQSGE